MPRKLALVQIYYMLNLFLLADCVVLKEDSGSELALAVVLGGSWTLITLAAKPPTNAEDGTGRRDQLIAGDRHLGHPLDGQVSSEECPRLDILRRTNACQWWQGWA